MRASLAGSVLVLAIISTAANAQDTSPMRPAVEPNVEILAPREAPLPDFTDPDVEAAERCVADFSLPYICCADDAAMGATADEHRDTLRLARERFCVNDAGVYPTGIGPDGTPVDGPGVAPDAPVKPVETESDAFGSSERPH